MTRKKVVACVVLSVVTALFCALYGAITKDAWFVQCRVLVDAETTFSLYTNTGTGYRETLSDHRTLPASSLWQSIKFPIQSRLFKSLRLDFVSRHDAVIVNRCIINNKNGMPLLDSSSIALGELHQVRLQRDLSHGYTVATAFGEDPQIALFLNWTQIVRKAVQPGFCIAAFFMSYLVWSLLFLLWRGMMRKKNSREKKAFIHAPLLVLGGLCWVLGGFAVWIGQSRHILLPVAEQAQVLPLPAAFPAESVRLNRPDGLAIAARLYHNQGAIPLKGNILLLHGNYPQGQMFPLYPLLAEGLARRGFRVLTIDFAGFGQSADPFALPTPVRTDLETETAVALAYLKSLPQGGNKLCIIGHSMGSNPALGVGLDDPEVAALMLIGPPRRVGNRFLDQNDLSFFWNWGLGIGKSQYKREGYPSWYTQRQWQEYYLEHDMVHALPALRGWRHKPVYVMDGGMEPQSDLVFLQDFAGRMSEPSGYVTMAGTDHNINVLVFQATPTYEPGTVQQAVDILEGWCSQEESPLTPVWYLLQNVLRWLFPFS